MFIWYFDGDSTQWVPAMVGSPGPAGPAGPPGPQGPPGTGGGEASSIEVLTADQTRYVDPINGNNTTGDGTVTKPFQSLPGAIHYLCEHISLNSWTLEIKLLDGVHEGYSTGGDNHPYFRGPGRVWVHGNNTNPEAVILRGLGWEAFGVNSTPDVNFFISDLKAESTGSYGVLAIGYTQLLLGRPEMGGYGGRFILGRFGTPGFNNYGISAGTGGIVVDSTEFGIEINTGGVEVAGIAQATDGGLCRLINGIQIIGHHSFHKAFAWAADNGSVQLYRYYPEDASNTCTGVRYIIERGGQIWTDPVSDISLDEIPGSLPGINYDREEADDHIATKLLKPGTNVGLVYDDAAGTITINSSASGGSGGIPEAPNDGSLYGRKSLGWTQAAPIAAPVFTGSYVTATGGFWTHTGLIFLAPVAQIISALLAMGFISAL